MNAFTSTHVRAPQTYQQGREVALNRYYERPFKYRDKTWTISTDAWWPGVAPPPIEIRPCIRFDDSSDIRFLSFGTAERVPSADDLETMDECRAAALLAGTGAVGSRCRCAPMTQVHFDINGKRLDLDEMFNSDAHATAVILGAIAQQFKKRLEGIRCPVHDEFPTVRFYGSSAHDMEREVQGCCDELVEMARRRL